MARYEHLPIYKKAMELSVYLQNTVRNFSRYNKYSVGADLRELSRSILLLIIRANSTRDKEKPLTELVERCEMLKTMLVFAKEIKAFDSFKSFQIQTVCLPKKDGRNLPLWIHECDALDDGTFRCDGTEADACLLYGAFQARRHI